MKPKTALFVVGIVAVVVVAALFGARIADRFYTYQGSLLEPPIEAFDFELTDYSDSTFKLSDQRGKAVLLFFGYANCPDVCPATLSEFKKVHSQLGDQADEVEFVFITIDPERDTPEQIHKYVSAFDPSFHGLSGSSEDLQPVWDGYFVFREKVEADSAVGYLMDHSSYVYLIDPQGDLRLTYPFGIAAEALVDDLSHILRE